MANMTDPVPFGRPGNTLSNRFLNPQLILFTPSIFTWLIDNLKIIFKLSNDDEIYVRNRLVKSDINAGSSMPDPTIIPIFKSVGIALFL